MGGYVEHVISAIEQVMELTGPSEIRPETRLEEDLGFDSGLFIELIMHLEDHILGLTIDPATLRSEDFLTVSTTAAFVARRLQAAG